MSCVVQKIRETRAKSNLLFRQVAAQIESDTASLSKAEHCERNVNREQVVKLAQLLKSSEHELVSLGLCDKAIEAVGKDPRAEQGIKMALTKIKG